MSCLPACLLAALNTQIWDLGGQQNLRPFWSTYYKGADAVIMVVDSTDRARIGVAKVRLRNRGTGIVWFLPQVGDESGGAWDEWVSLGCPGGRPRRVWRVRCLARDGLMEQVPVTGRQNGTESPQFNELD